MIYKKSDVSEKAVALLSHRRVGATICILNKRCYWPSISLLTKKYIKECSICQHLNPAILKIVPELQNSTYT